MQFAAPVSREQIYTALMGLLKNKVTGVVTYTRYYRAIEEFDPPQMPVLILVQISEQAEPRPRGIPTKWTLRADLILYAQDDGADQSAGQETSVPATQINNLIDAIQQALAPAPATGVQTLGGVVSHCWIEGEIKHDEGFYGKRALAIVPVNIVATA